MTPRLWLADLLKSLLLGALIGLPIAAAVLWLMGSAGGLWWLWAWGLWMGFNLLLMVVYPTFIARCSTSSSRWPDVAQGPRHRADAALRLSGQGPVRDGRQPPQRPRQRLLHRLWQRQARGVSTPCSQLSPAEVEPCWRTSWATSSTAHRASAW
jgi:hypothetical protein